jgi:hypothetical protein
MTRWRSSTLAVAASSLVLLTAGLQAWMGRLVLGPDGRFGWWESDIWSPAMSQRFADPYSLTHVLHGVLFYAGLWLVWRRAPLASRALAALALEAGWEVLENSPIVIDRYRQVTMALGYSGDSILNSIGDVLMMAAGFWLAARLPVRASVALVVAVEVGLLAALRDNLALNILMLIYPIEAIRLWQLEAAPPGVPR